MQALPSIEVLSFLNWINLEGYPNLHIDIPLDDLFLNYHEHDELLYNLANKYLENKRYHDMESSNDIAVVLIDSFVALFRAKAIEHIRKYPLDTFSDHQDFHYIHNLLADSFHDAMNAFHKSAAHISRPNRQSPFNLFRGRHSLRSKSHINVHDLVQSVYVYFSYESDPAITALIASNPSSIAHATLSFLYYIEEYTTLRNTNIRNVPSNVMGSVIDDYLWYTYSHDYGTESQRQHSRELLYKVFIEHQYDQYLGHLLPSTDFSTVVTRMFCRHVRYKCTLLCEGNSLFDFVKRNWQELNDYSAEYLDIFYNEQELLQRGYATADKLNIRSRVLSYPSIYLWEYDLNNGYAIPINDLDDQELLDIFKAIADQSCQKKSLSDIVSSATLLVDQIHASKEQRKNDEQILTDLLLNACRELQNQRIWYRSEGRSENSRNTFISSLLSQSSFIPKDQSLGGESSTGISIGENDIKIFRNQNEPFAIIEALNLSAMHGKDWHHKNFREHVNRIYKYDTNGLAQNYLLIYADTPMFDVYWKSILNEFTITNKCKFGTSEFLDVTDLPDLSNTDLRIGVVRYRRNGRIIKLYVIAVLMEAHPNTPIDPAAQAN